MPQKLLKKKKQKQKAIVDLGALSEIAESKDKDFDLDIDASKFQGKKGKVVAAKRDSHRMYLCLI